MKQIKIKKDRIQSLHIGLYPRHYIHFNNLIKEDIIDKSVGHYIRQLIDDDMIKRGVLDERRIKKV